MDLEKGISPLIAAVMLLAFAMAVGGIFSEWSGELVDSSTRDTTDSQQQVLDCSAKSIEISKTDTSSNWLNITLRSDGGDLGNVTVTAFPSQEQETIQLRSAGVIDTASFNVEEQQQRFTAASQSCAVSLEEDISY